MTMDNFALCREYPAYAPVDEEGSEYYVNGEIPESNKALGYG